MISRTINVSIEESRNVRPEAVLVQVASKYECHIDVEYDNKKVNAKSIIGMMSLGIYPGEMVTVYADGIDETMAVNDIEKYLSSK